MTDAKWPTREEVAREVTSVLYATDAPQHTAAALQSRLIHYEEWGATCADRILALFPKPAED